jgi:predicted Zn-dependent peptidase
LAEKYFGTIPAQPPPPKPDVSEPPNAKQRSKTETDRFARVPAVALGWKMPPPGDPDYVPLAVLGELLVNGEASRFYQKFVKGNETLLEVSGGLGWPLGNAFTMNGPTLLVIFAPYKPATTAPAVVAAMQKEIDGIASGGVAPNELERTKNKMLSDFYSQLEQTIERADQLAILQLFSGDAASINRIPEKIGAVTVADVKRAAARHLTPANSAWIDRQPAPQAPAGQ